MPRAQPDRYLGVRRAQIYTGLGTVQCHMQHCIVYRAKYTVLTTPYAAQPVYVYRSGLALRSCPRDAVA